MSNERFASIWDAIENTPVEAANLRLRSALMMALREHIERGGLTPAQAAERLGVTQEQVSDLVRGRIDGFSLDALVDMASAAGLQVDLRVREAA